jgi:hypothetical protein
MAAFLRQIGRRQIDGDAFGRQGEADGVQRAPHPLAALGHGLVGKADNGEGGHARTDLDLHVHGAGFDAFEGDRGNPGEHPKPPVFSGIILAKHRRHDKNNIRTLSLCAEERHVL